MRQLGTCNFGAYARKMLIDGYIILCIGRTGGMVHTMALKQAECRRKSKEISAPRIYEL